MRPVKAFIENITWTQETKYLGVTLDLKLTYKTHISCILRKAKQLNKSSTTDINLGLITYKSHVSFDATQHLELVYSLNAKKETHPTFFF
jgi:hypothetical protein